MTGRRPIGKGNITFARHKSSCEDEPPKKKLRTVGERMFCESSIETIFATYPLKLLIPEHASSSNCHWLYCITYGGGLVEGDDIQLNVVVDDGCSALMTTQSSTKIFHCEGGDQTKQTMTFDVGEDALLAIIPDPLIPFKNANYKQTQTVNMTCSSNLVLLDWYSAGRIARGELWEFSKLHTINKVVIDGEIVFLDAVCLSNTSNLEIGEAMMKYHTLGCLVLLGPDLEELSEQLLKKYGKHKTYGCKYENEDFYGISAISCEIGQRRVTGCVLKFAADKSSKAYVQLDSILEPLYDVLGGNPFSSKY